MAGSIELIASTIAKTALKDAPLLASVLSGGNPIVGLITTAIMHAFNVQNPNDLQTIISSNPDSAIKLKQIEEENKELLLKYQSDIYQAEVNDRANARDREEKIIAATGKRDLILDWIAILVIAGFFTLCLVNYFIKLTDDHIVSMLIGQISSGFVMVLSYYFGSSNK